MVVVFFLIILIAPILIKQHVSFDAIHNVGAISLYIFFVKVVSFKLRIGKGGIIFYTSKNEKDIPIELSKGKIRFYEQLFTQLKQKIVIKQMNVFSNIGLSDAKNSAMVAGLFNIVILSAFSVIKKTKKSARFKHVNNVAYNQNKFAFAIYAQAFITLFDIIYSVIMSLLIVRRSEKYESFYNR